MVGRKHWERSNGLRIKSALDEARLNDAEYNINNEAEMEDAIKASRTMHSQMKQHDQSESDFISIQSF